jgi:hypothetical protein
MRIHRSIAAIATLMISAVLAITALSAVSATAKTPSEPADKRVAAAATTAPAFPTFVHLPADQAAHPDAPQEWWYVVGHLTAHGHRFGYEVQIVAGATPYALIAITDKTTGQYYTHSQGYSPDQTRFSTTTLDVRVDPGIRRYLRRRRHCHRLVPGQADHRAGLRRTARRLAIGQR